MSDTGGPSRERALVRAAARLHGALLVAYPPAFRRRHGAEMARLFRDRARAAAAARGGPGVAGLMLGALRDLVTNAPAEWLRPAGRRPRETRGGGGGMGGMTRDFAWALRALRRSPGFAATAVLTIALAMGANTAIFSVVQAVLLRPLPYRDPDQLVMVWADLHTRSLFDFPISPPDFIDIEEQSTTLTGVAAAVTGEGTLTEAGDPVRVTTGQGVDRHMATGPGPSVRSVELNNTHKTRSRWCTPVHPSPPRPASQLATAVPVWPTGPGTPPTAPSANAPTPRI